MKYEQHRLTHKCTHTRAHTRLFYSRKRTRVHAHVLVLRSFLCIQLFAPQSNHPEATSDGQLNRRQCSVAFYGG